MKNRSVPFECAIAAKTVGISLRHGGGLQEPGKVYVRCDERDCQYVDLNEPPCPLRVDMFADGSDLKVARHLVAHAGQDICYACLTDSLGITHDQVRRATWSLREEMGVVIRPSRCGACRRRRVTIGLAAGSTVRLAGLAAGVPDDARARQRVIRHEGAPEDLDVPRRVLQFIGQANGAPYCPSCLAFATDLPLGEIRRALQTLDGMPALDRGEAPCEVCGRYQPIVAARPAAADRTPTSRPSDVAAGWPAHRASGAERRLDQHPRTPAIDDTERQQIDATPR